MNKLRERKAWQFFAALPKADKPLAIAWYSLLVLRGTLPALLAVASGALITAVEDQRSLTGPLVFVGVVFIAMQVCVPLHQATSANLGSRMSAWLNDRLMAACTQPPGVAHLERPDLINDLSVARDFDLGIMGPPLHISMDFIANGLAEMVAGIAAAIVLFGFAWWAPLVLVVCWGSTHWLLREGVIWHDRNTPEVRDAQRHADYAYRLAVDAPAAKELRLFGLAPWVVGRFSDRRRLLHELRWRATKLREKSVISALIIVLAGNVLVFWSIANQTADGRLGLGGVVVFLQTAVGVSAIAFGGFGWALDGTAAPIAAVLKLEGAMAPVGALPDGTILPSVDTAPEIRFRDVSFAYDGGSRAVLDDFNLTIPAGTSMAIVGVNGAGKTTLAKLMCRLYDPQHGAIEIDGTDMRSLQIDAWRSQVTAVFQDFVRYELSLRDNVAPTGTDSDATVQSALAAAGAGHLVDDLSGLDTIMARGYPGGTELSGGQWQRVALARATHAVHQGAGVVLLDEPTAQLDVRGEAEIFDRILHATSGCTTILISHRFSTVRHADCICVVEHGKAVELGTHAELMELGGRYATMFELQASRFTTEPERNEDGEAVTYESLG